MIGRILAALQYDPNGPRRPGDADGEDRSSARSPKRAGSECQLSFRTTGTPGFARAGSAANDCRRMTGGMVAALHHAPEAPGRPGGADGARQSSARSPKSADSEYQPSFLTNGTPGFASASSSSKES